MIEINAKQRKFLEKNAQPLNALVQIGGAGVSENQIAQINRLLAEHELIKVKFNEFKDEKRELSSEIAEKTDSTTVRLIGNVLILYKAAEEVNDRKFEKELIKLAK
ncbi:MAG: YhbY family RNA-binding protein [Treponema sp.]|nr:YhbY family RNA-binding protein [Treponema sp.]